MYRPLSGNCQKHTKQTQVCSLSLGADISFSRAMHTFSGTQILQLHCSLLPFSSFTNMNNHTEHLGDID